ncbi:hypothetical protein SAMN05421866_3484 [Chryseobacterium oranimense]|uniref:Phage tail assembly chaperone protein, TAC n=1 Tax=Chryseobacterium oranimense TaxID=421058 RepID=A0A1M5V0E8_9FLAO|nr:hypothetical protein [Chryseobacterium oranimense]SHH68777.1 hypothetical protein SAMN05421866_3484 [Chryseobacterium oranimense]
MNHTVLTFNEVQYKAKFGLTVIGQTIKDLNTDLTSFFNEFANNAPLVAPVLIFNSLKKGNPEVEFTLEQVEDMIDEDGGLASPQLKKFLEGFTASIKVDVEPGKQKKAPVKKK